MTSQQPPKTTLRQSPLHQRHEAAGAKFAEFGGWSMPLEYAGGGVLAEHTAVRESVGIFDVSHLGTVTVSGADAIAFGNRVLTNDLDRIEAGKAQYTLLCNESGGVVDDMIAYRKADDEIFLVPNAGNTATVVEILSGAVRAGEDVTVDDQHGDFAIIAVQGPRSDEVLTAIGLPTEIDYMGFVDHEVDGVPLTVCRTGYTGERGCEVVLPAAAAPELWDRLLTAGESLGIRPAGLGARDTLRTEMGYSLHGQDISPEITPVQARLGFAIARKKPEFFGREALAAERAAGQTRTARGLRAAGRGIPRPGMSVVDADGTEIGVVTSGTFSPTLKTGIALALIDTAHEVGETVQVVVRNRTEPFEIVKPPFVNPEVRNS
ncbi:glycine cleavage system aminomethyltransferase GcvT [Propionibacteriaceae bacterium Y2011]